MVFKLQSGHDFATEIATYKVQRGITKNVYIQELWFLRSALYSVLGIAKVQSKNVYPRVIGF